MTKLIIGCGYLGRRVARRWRAAGHAVTGVVRHEEQARLLETEGIGAILADVTRLETLGQLPPAETVLFSVGFDPAGGQSRRAVYVDGLHAVLDRIPTAAAVSGDVSRVILVSSTGVYGEAGGDWVDEDSPCRPTRESGRALLDAENVLATHPLGRVGIVLRLAGLYGPGRLPRTDDLRSGRPLSVSPRQYVNLIHVDDAAAVVLAAESHARPPRTYVVSDGRPVDRREYLRRLAEVLDLPSPRYVDDAQGLTVTTRSEGDKRIRNRRMLEELGVVLEYPSYWEGLAASINV